MNKIVPYVKYVKSLGLNCKPKSMQLNTINRCASKCTFCRKHEWGLPDMPKKRVADLLKEFNDMGVETVLFSGGDPLLMKDEVWDVILKNQGNLEYGMLTAGNIPFKRWNEIVPNFRWVRFSIDSLDPKIYEKIRGVKQNKFVLNNLIEVSTLIRQPSNCRINYVFLEGINDKEEIRLKSLAKDLNIDFMKHSVHTFTELGDDWDAGVKECIVPLLYAIIECDGFVHSCCIIMDENNDYDKVRNDLSLGNINNFKTFSELWFSPEATKKKKLLMEAKLEYCNKWCLPRYYSVNACYRDMKDKGIFL